MKIKLLIFYFFLSCNINGQNSSMQEFLEPLKISILDSIYHLKQNTQYLIDIDRNMTFKKAKDLQFNTTKNYNSNPHANHWFKFIINPQLKSKYIYFLNGISDDYDFYIPYKYGYKKFKVGILTKNKKISFDIVEASNLVIKTDSINFSEPFYIYEKPKSDWGKLNLEVFPFVGISNNPANIDNIIKEDSFKFNFSIYSAIIFASFILFFVNFIVSQDKNYLNYSLYLLFTAIMFANRLPFLFNFLNSINPNLFYYSRHFTIIATSGIYFYFVFSFLGFKSNFPIIYKFSLYFLRSIIIFGILHFLIIIYFPTFRFRFILFDSFKVIFTLVSVIIFTILLFQKLHNIFKAVLISSLLLIIGNILSIITNNSFYFLNAVLVDIIIFSGIVSYNNKINTKKRFQNRFQLEQEKKEKQNLLELDILKSNFFANISHEFRTPLTLISIPIEETLSDDSISDKKRQQFIIAKQNSERLLSLVNQLLDLSTIDGGHLKLHIQEANVLQLIAALSESFVFNARQKNITYNISIIQNDEKVWFDKDAVEKITINLLSNALKYTPENGLITCIAYTEDNKLYLEIKNSGEILTSEELKNIFERFYQTKEENHGTGIGLSLVKELVELHNGTIEVTSNKNECITFKVILSVNKNSFNKETIIGISNNCVINEIPLNYPTIENEEEFVDSELPILLIVEDNDDLRNLLKNKFEKNYYVITANNGQLGVELAFEHIPDIIISDIMMPVKDGIALTKELKNDERTAHIPILLLSAKAGESNMLLGLETGADDYMVKPFSSKLLKTKIAKLIEIRKKLQARYSQELILMPKDIAITSLDEKFLEKVQTVLENKLVESSFSIEDFSLAVNMSRMQLHRKIKALTGLSASEFIRSQRLKLAAQILKKSDINISQVGYSVGFNDHSYFTKCFKEAYFCTPTEYAKRIT